MSLVSLWAVQEAVCAALKNTSALTALLAEADQSVFDHVPARPAFPYVVMEGFTLAPNDTQGLDGAEVSATIRAFSRYEGQNEVKAIMAAIIDALHHANLDAAGQVIVLSRLEFAGTALQPDGLTREGTVRMRFFTEP